MFFLLFFFTCLSLGFWSERINVRYTLWVWKTGETIRSSQLLLMIEVKIVKECLSHCLLFSRLVSHAAKVEFTEC